LILFRNWSIIIKNLAAGLIIITLKMFKIRKTLTDRQLIKCKVTGVLSILVISIQIITSVAVSQFTWMDQEFVMEDIATYERGQIVTYTNNDDFCSR
jgi:hypothetical protein